MTPAVRLALATLALTAALVPVTTAVAGKGGASPGVQLGGRGIATADGALRYVARQRAGVTTVTAIDRDGQVARTGSVTGVVGIPRVAFDGSLGGLAFDGPSLVLAAPAPVSGRSRFVVLATSSLRVKRTVTLRGSWSFDAISPDGAKLYLVEHARAGSPTYRVRAYDLLRGRLVREAVIDPRLGGRAMTGMPVTQAFGPGARLGVHALPEARRASRSSMRSTRCAGRRSASSCRGAATRDGSSTCGCGCRAGRSSCEASAAPSSRGSTRGSSWCTRTTTRSEAPSPVPPSRPRSRVPPRRCRGSR